MEADLPASGASTEPWYPRPRGAAPHGPGGVPKRWSNSLGCWEAAEAAESGAAKAAMAATHHPRPRGAVRRRPLPPPA
eukprot:5725156-Prymnesium_polylepis.1